MNPRARQGSYDGPSSRARAYDGSYQGSSRKSTRDPGSQGRAAHGHARSKGSQDVGFLSRIFSSKPAIIILVIIVLLGGVALWDTATNWGRAYGNIYINGIAVGGMDRTEMSQVLKEEIGPKVSHAQVNVFSDASTERQVQEALEVADRAAHSDEVADIESLVEGEYWTTDALGLKAMVPYDQAIDEAISIGREDGGLWRRFTLPFDAVDITLGVDLNQDALEDLATQIDEASGDPRIDATVSIYEAYAIAVEGHDGLIVDRELLAQDISDALMSGQEHSAVMADLVAAPSRITMEQAEEMAGKINHALGCDALFSYNENRYKASDVDLGDWTRVQTVEGEEGFELGVDIDPGVAIPAVTKGADAYITAEDTTVSFEWEGDEIIVYTGGDGLLPEVAAAVETLNAALYGQDGIAWSTRVPSTISIQISETDKPERLTLDEAISLEIVSVIGEFTSEFANYVGTENRNHNIKLAADMLDECIIDADGGIWSFNDEAGDTNEEAGFWSAGSIVDGELTDSIGGGICQVATTIFNAVYEAGLPIPTRHNHSLYLDNYPDGRDAGINYPDMDLVWRNDLDSDVLLMMSYTDDSLTAKLYSVYTGYTVETQVGEWSDGEKYSIRFEEDETLAKGAYYKKTSGADGSEIAVTRVVKDQDGNVIDTYTFSSVYSPKDEIYCVGPGTDTTDLKKALEEARKDDEDTDAEEE